MNAIQAAGSFEEAMEIANPVFGRNAAAGEAVAELRSSEAVQFDEMLAALRGAEARRSEQA